MKLLRLFFALFKWHFHSNNLNDLPGDRQGSILKHGRCWLNNSHEYMRYDGKLHYKEDTWGIMVEWLFGGHHCSINFHLGTGDVDEDLGLSFCIPYVLNLWMEIKAPWIKRLCYRVLPIRHYNYKDDGSHSSRIGSDREISIRVFDWAIWWSLWMPVDECRLDEPWYRRENFRPIDFLFGRQDYSARVIDEGVCVIPMPEGCYIATYKTKFCEWTRKRSPFKETRFRTEVDIPGGIPVPGKGENSWDCEDDAVNRVSFPGRTKWEAISGIVETVMRDRIRYGGSEWMNKREENRVINKEGSLC